MRTITAQTITLLVLCASAGLATAGDSVVDAVAWTERSEADRISDPDRKPKEVLEFLDIQPGMRVLDLFSGGGYYTEILSRVVGENGSVVAHNNQAYMDYAEESLAKRFDEGRFDRGNVLAAQHRSSTENRMDRTEISGFSVEDPR